MPEGDTAPDFELPDQDGKTVKLSDFAGKNVVLYFYPKADTPGCTIQACGVRDRRRTTRTPTPSCSASRPTRRSAVKRFADKYGLNFTLLADEDHAVAESYGVWVEKSMYGKKYWGIERSTFVIGPDGKVAHVIPKVSPKTHDDEALAALARLRDAA